MKSRILVADVGVTELTKWLVNRKKIFLKKNGRKVTISDVQQYTNKLGRLPLYMGGNIIEICSEKFYKRTYNLLSDEI